MNYTERYIYRIQQTTTLVLNTTVPQLIISIWSGKHLISILESCKSYYLFSGLSMQFEIIGENLECVLTLPEKFRTHIEGLAGNFDGDYSDDLFNRQTNQTIPISSATNQTALDNDADVLNACRSCKFYPNNSNSLIG